MYLWDEELITDLPRKIAKYANVKIPKPKPRFFTLDEIHLLYDRGEPFQRLILLLGLNCGYTQVYIHIGSILNIYSYSLLSFLYNLKVGWEDLIFVFKKLL
jgi:integrase